MTRWWERNESKSPEMSNKSMHGVRKKNKKQKKKPITETVMHRWEKLKTNKWEEIAKFPQVAGTVHLRKSVWSHVWSPMSLFNDRGRGRYEIDIIAFLTPPCVWAVSSFLPLVFWILKKRPHGELFETSRNITWRRRTCKLKRCIPD